MFLAWFASPLGRKVLIGVGVTLAFLMLLRWYGNRQYYAGKEQQSRDDSELARKAATAARDEEIRKLEAERAEVEADSQQNSIDRAKLSADQRSIANQLQGRLTGIENALRGDMSKPVLDGELPDAIRQQLVKLRN